MIVVVYFVLFEIPSTVLFRRRDSWNDYYVDSSFSHAMYSLKLFIMTHVLYKLIFTLDRRKGLA
jgi:hypothetical protein